MSVKTKTQPTGTSGAQFARTQVNWPALIRTASVYGVVAILWIALWRLTPYFLTGSNLANVGIQASNLAILAAGLTIVLIVAEIDLSIGALEALTGSLAAIIIIHAALPTWIGIVVALAAG